MKVAATTANKQNQSRAVANNVSQQKTNSREDSGFVDNRPETKALKSLQMMINNSPRMAAQRQRTSNITGGKAQVIKGPDPNVPDGPADSSKFIRLYAPSPDSQRVEIDSNQTDDSRALSDQSIIIQRIVDRNAVEQNARAIMIRWLETPAKYEAIGREYEALLAGIDNYQRIMASTNVAKYGNKEGVEGFKEFAINQISTLRRLCMELTLKDDDGDLDDVVVNFVLNSLNKEELIITKISNQFLNGIPYLKATGWDAQFAGNSYKKAIEIAEFALPLYEGGYSEERAFIRSAEGMPEELRYEHSGYKLHISIHEISMKAARDRILPILRQAKYQHKIVANHSVMQGGQTGKIITIYPKTIEEVKKPDGFNPLIQLLEPVLGNVAIPGPPVQGEKQVDQHGYIFLEKDARYK